MMMVYTDCDVHIGNDYASRNYRDLARVLAENWEEIPDSWSECLAPGD
jgi:hypothetical protein